MNARGPSTRRKRNSALDAALLFVIVLLITQMWLLTATLESYLAGHHDVAGPAFVTSLVLFAACSGIYGLVRRLDRRSERDVEPHSAGPWRIG